MRAWQAAGSVYVMLADRERGEQRQRDLETARDWYRRSMAEWRKLEPLQGFTAARTKEMASTVADMAALQDRPASSR